MFMPHPNTRLFYIIKNVIEYFVMLIGCFIRNIGCLIRYIYSSKTFYQTVLGFWEKALVLKTRIG